MAPRIKGRGTRGQSIPKGYLLGRIGSGAGDVQLLRGRDLRGFGIGGENQAAALARTKAGFQFFEQGLMLADEVLGAGTWARDVTFTDGDTDSVITSLTPAASASALRLMAPDPITFVPTVVGTFNFAIGATLATIAWLGGSYTNPAGTVVTLHAPLVADATLANVTGLVNGVGA